LENELLIGSTLMDMYAKCGLLLEARNIFDSGPVHDIVVWNILIMGYAENDCGEEALSVSEQMQENGMSPNDVTYLGCLKACAIIGNTSQGQAKGREFHAEVFKKGFDTEPLIGSVLIDMYIKCHFLAEAQQVFDTLPSGAMISSSPLISGYARHGWSEGAAYCLEKKEEEGISSNAVTLICELKASGNAGSTSMGARVHAEIIKKGFDGEAVIGNSLVAMYAKCGLAVEAQEVFDKLPVRDTTSWNALLLGYANVGESESVFHVFENRIAECMGRCPCPVTFLSLLNACNHCGLVSEGLVCMEIVGNYNIAVSIDHCACAVDLFARAGDIDIAEEMIEKMPFHPDVAMWHMLLAACWRTTNVELGREIFGHAVQLDEEDISAYVCMSNIYADCHYARS
jgi:pentatricopeptide repeat protein